jgi:dUTP pyrophosphatase
MIMKFAKIKEGARAPERSNPSDAGADLFYCGEDVVIYPAEPADPFGSVASAVLSTGLKFEIPEGYMLEIKNRSSVAAKKGLIVGACVCDAGYAGEVFINLHNISGRTQHIKNGDKIAQAVLVKIDTPILAEASESELYKDINVNSNRGEGGFGSTGE